MNDKTARLGGLFRLTMSQGRVDVECGMDLTVDEHLPQMMLIPRRI